MKVEQYAKNYNKALSSVISAKQRGLAQEKDSSFIEVAPALAWDRNKRCYCWLQTTIQSSGVEVKELGDSVSALENDIFTEIYGGNHA